MTGSIVNALLPVQAGVTVIAIAAAIAWPPATGRMMLVPLASRDSGASARIALAADAMLLGPGPFSGSLVVIGDRAEIMRQDRGWTVLVVAAPPAGCGEDVAGPVPA